MKDYIIFIIISLFPLALNSQNLFTGKVIDEQKHPVEFANVVLYSLPDSALIAGTVTNAEGAFTLNSPVNTQNAFFKVSFVGYQTQLLPATQGKTIVLKVDSNLLNEVVVKVTLPKIQLKGDALLTTVQNSVLSKAGTGNDVLKRLPMLTGDKGAFSVFGKGEARIYINNREMRDPSELDNLSSSDIKDVEIVTNPGARYDASVKAVIRINTVRKVGDGFSFDVRSSYYQSENTDLTEQLNANYRRNKWDIFGTLIYRHNEWLQNSKVWQKTYVDTLWLQNNKLYSHGFTNTFTVVAGVNYEISTKHYVGLRYTMSVFPPSNKAYSSLNSTVLADGVFYDKWSSNDEEITNNKPVHRLNAYYNGSFGKLRVDFNTDFYSNQLSSGTIVFETSQKFENRTVSSENNVNNRLFASKLMFSYPVLGGQFSLGSEYTNTHREDRYNNKENYLPSSSTSIYEQNNSIFAEYSHLTPIGRLGAGIRYEYVRSDYFGNGEKIDEQSRHYEQWFPNFSFATKLKNVSMQLSYTAKTKRPTYRQLGSNVFYANRFTMQSGNPFLKPSVIHDVTIVGSWKIAQLMISYKNERDAIIYWTEQMNENQAISIIKYRNLDKLPTLSAFLTVSPTFGVWSPQASVGLIKQWVTIISNNQSVTLNKPMPVASLNNSFSLPKNFVLTADASIQGKGNYQNVYISDNQFVVNMGVSKSFFNNQLRIDLKGHDLFRGKKNGNLFYNKQMELYQFNRYDTREIELTIRFRFNSAKSKYKGTGAGNSEINRF